MDDMFKFECNNGYNLIRKTNPNGDDLSTYNIYLKLGDEKGSLCFNDLNTSKLNLIQKMPI